MATYFFRCRDKTTNPLGKVVVKTIGFNEKGDMVINGKSASKFRLMKQNEDVKVIISEYMDGNLGVLFKKNKVKKKHVIVILFQVCYTLVCIQNKLRNYRDKMYSEVAIKGNFYKLRELYLESWKWINTMDHFNSKYVYG